MNIKNMIFFIICFLFISCIEVIPLSDPRADCRKEFSKIYCDELYKK